MRRGVSLFAQRSSAVGGGSFVLASSALHSLSFLRMRRLFIQSALQREEGNANGCTSSSFCVTPLRFASSSAGTSSKNSSSSSSSAGEKKSSSEGPKVEEVQKPPVGKFHKYAREHGVFFAIYFMTVCELFAWLLTYLVHANWIAGGDVAVLVGWLGASKYVDVEKYANYSISVFGLFELTGRLAMNYVVCSSIAPVFYPALLPFCLSTTPPLKRIVFFWKKVPAPAAV